MPEEPEIEDFAETERRAAADVDAEAEFEDEPTDDKRRPGARRHKI